jgi:putative oxidoreductase
MDGLNAGSLVLRLLLAVVMFAHGYNHVFNGGKLPGVARWFASLGFKAPRLQAALASYTELGVAPLLVAGFLTPLAAAGVVGTMFVAFIANHRKNGFFIFRPGEGYEYVLTLQCAALALGSLGGGEWSIDHALDVADDLEGWLGLGITAGAGFGLGAVVLALFWRPAPPAASG